MPDSTKTTTGGIGMTAREIAQKAILCGIDRKQKEGATNGGYLWDLENMIEKEINQHTLSIIEKAVGDYKKGFGAGGVMIDEACEEIIDAVKQELGVG